MFLSRGYYSSEMEHPTESGVNAAGMPEAKAIYIQETRVPRTGCLEADHVFNSDCRRPLGGAGWWQPDATLYRFSAQDFQGAHCPPRADWLVPLNLP